MSLDSKIHITASVLNTYSKVVSANSDKVPTLVHLVALASAERLCLELGDNTGFYAQKLRALREDMDRAFSVLVTENEESKQSEDEVAEFKQEVNRGLGLDEDGDPQNLTFQSIMKMVGRFRSPTTVDHKLALERLIRVLEKYNQHNQVRSVEGLTNRTGMWRSQEPLSLEEARVRNLCRICHQEAHPRQFGNVLDPFVLDYGKEFAHASCLCRPSVIRDNSLIVM